MDSDIFQLLKNGTWLYGGASDHPTVSEKLQHAANVCFDINRTMPSDIENREKKFRSLLGSIGESFIIHSPFRCDFGFNIHIGDNFIGNFNLSILDEAEVRIGDNVMIGPNCSLITISHALVPDQRQEGIMQAKAITIEDNVWIASNVVVLPGVTIGEGSVIAAGSVVTKSIPPRMLAAGIPCRPLKPITDKDRVDI